MGKKLYLLFTFKLRNPHNNDRRTEEAPEPLMLGFKLSHFCIFPALFHLVMILFCFLKYHVLYISHEQRDCAIM